MSTRPSRRTVVDRSATNRRGDPAWATVPAQEAERLFAVIRDEAVIISRATRAPLEDVEQEMRVMCLEVAQGTSHYDPRRGPLRPWLIVRAWRTARRWGWASARGEEFDPERALETAGGGYGGDRSCAPGIDDALIDEEERRMHERYLERAHKHGDRIADPRTTFEILAAEHWSERDAVKWCGGSRKVARLAKRRAAALQPALAGRAAPGPAFPACHGSEPAPSLLLRRDPAAVGPSGGMPRSPEDR